MRKNKFSRGFFKILYPQPSPPSPPPCLLFFWNSPIKRLNRTYDLDFDEKWNLRNFHWLTKPLSWDVQCFLCASSGVSHLFACQYDFFSGHRRAKSKQGNPSIPTAAFLPSCYFFFINWNKWKCLHHMFFLNKKDFQLAVRMLARQSRERKC